MQQTIPQVMSAQACALNLGISLLDASSARICSISSSDIVSPAISAWPMRFALSPVKISSNSGIQFGSCHFLSNLRFARCIANRLVLHQLIWIIPSVLVVFGAEPHNVENLRPTTAAFISSNQDLELSVGLRMLETDEESNISTGKFRGKPSSICRTVDCVKRILVAYPVFICRMLEDEVHTRDGNRLAQPLPKLSPDKEKDPSERRA